MISRNLLRTILTRSMKVSTRNSKTNAQRVSHYDHYSYVVAEEQIVEWGRNMTKNVPPVHWGYNQFQGVHSELSAYMKASGLLRDREFGVVNVRLSKGLKLLNSAPCPNCRRMLKSLGAKWVVYSTPDGFKKVNL